MPGALAGTLATARLRWPEVSVQDVAFERFLEARSVDPRSLEPGRIEELYLICACLAGDAAAVRALDSEFLPEVDRALARLGQTGATDDVRQQVRRAFFAPERDKPSKLESFSGRGPLAAWVRVVAVRMASNLHRRTRRETLEDSDRWARSPAITPSPELQVLRERYRSDFEAALTHALQALSTRDRTVLRLHSLEGMSLDQIAQMYQVHRATAARWIASTRKALVDDTQRRIREALALSSGELQSLMAAVRSDLDVSLHRLLGGDKP
jgi:RNA polymerase sigma-70 factor (ECF subfamily)